ncbi:aldo/keto reductase [Microbacterium sp. STN6]|uniref:aldo/keto reductase n=1 Tax=Microbacterium sp. STN6 TaxID=2995588 RepID=UPI00226088A1|nr:aldo/keto reductase [Microbacterium sp. STN6]MCX7522563.1 aldo/keto reductase [Microbacterium sp. STN6]
MTGSTTAHPGGTYRLGNHHVSRIGFGAMALERLEHDRAAGQRLLRQAIALGVDHIDTADFYGDSVANEIIRSAVLPGENVVIATKVGAVRSAGGPLPLRPAQHPHELRASVEDNVRTLGRDRLDVVNLRRLDDARPGRGMRAEGDQLVDLDDQLAVMVAMRDEGLIGAIGVSGVDAAGLRRAIPAGIVCVQNDFSLVSRHNEDLLEICTAEGIAWVPFFPLGSAFPHLPKVAEQPEVKAAAARLGATPSQIGLAWLLGHAPNTLLIPGTSNGEHLAENVAVGEIVLDAETTAELDALWSRRFEE